MLTNPRPKIWMGGCAIGSLSTYARQFLEFTDGTSLLHAGPMGVMFWCQHSPTWDLYRSI